LCLFLLFTIQSVLHFNMKTGGDKSAINNHLLWCHWHYLNPQRTLHNWHNTRTVRYNRDTEGTAVLKSSQASGQHATISVNHLHARSCLSWFHKLQGWIAQWMPSNADLNRLQDLSWNLQYSQHWTTNMLHKGDIRRNSWTKKRFPVSLNTLTALSAHYALTGPSWPHWLISTATRTSDIPRHTAPCPERLLRSLADNIGFRYELRFTDSNPQIWL
jgi:hypothetical protein